MINEIKELLTIDTNSLKASDNKKLLNKIKQLLKGEIKLEKQEENVPSNLPFYAVSAIGNTSYIIKFNPETEEFKITNKTVDTRGGHMSFYNCKNDLQNKVLPQTKNK